ncbi:EAL domain-containing protein [Escherichia coli]|uniref:EAL domain-containing protein n=1 Tax=Escherichia coli TaxID=562 RepID=UPI002283C25B|nr:EAL domain-containing protein [Escherichia coli]MCZ0558488.1 EAL domain-containing protein [Escherichia coli]
MINWSCILGVYFIVEPIVDIKNNKLVAVEVLSRFYTQSGEQLSTQHTFLRLSSAMKINILQQQIKSIAEQKSFFIKNDLICSINVGYDTCIFIFNCKELQKTIIENDFIALEISETFPYFHENSRIIVNKLLNITNHIWVDDFGADNCKINISQLQNVGAVKLDKDFLYRTLNKEYFSEIIKRISTHCSKVIAEGIESQYILDKIRDVSLWGGQGYYYPSVKLSEIYKLQMYL